MLKFLRRFLKEEEDEQEILREKFSHFRRLLENNNQALAAMADMEEKLTGDFLFDTGYLHTQVENLSGCVREMINALNCLSPGPVSGIKPRLSKAAGRYPPRIGSHS